MHILQINILLQLLIINLAKTLEGQIELQKSRWAS